MIKILNKTCTLNAIKIQKNISKILAYYVIKINYFIQKKRN